MNIEEDNIAEAILYAGENMGHLHVGECNRKPVGKGNNIRWKEVFSALKTMNYKGRIVLEAFVKIGGQVGNDISIWRDTSNYADEATMDLDVKNSLEFVRRNLG